MRKLENDGQNDPVSPSNNPSSLPRMERRNPERISRPNRDDTVLLLTQDGIAFIGDIGFFDSQPFLGFCDIDLYREQLLSVYDADFPVLVPGHGPVGNNDDIALQLEYFDVMETLIGDIVHKGAHYKKP